MPDDNQAERRAQIRAAVTKILSNLFRVALMIVLLYLVFKYFAK